MSDKHIPVAGGCLCGAVRYESTEPPIDSAHCHCSMCRKATGSMHFSWVLFPDDAFSVTQGEIKYRYSSELTRRGFCADCGTPLAFLYEGFQTPAISVGSLDHPEDWPVSRHIYVESKPPWYVISDDLPQYPRDSAYLAEAKAYVEAKKTESKQ